MTEYNTIKPISSQISKKDSEFSIWIYCRKSFVERLRSSQQRASLTLDINNPLSRIDRSTTQ